MYILGILIAYILGMITVACISIESINNYIEQNNKLIRQRKELMQENSELKEIRDNAEVRAIQFARELKQVEDIVLQEGQGSIVDRFDKIKEVITSNQTNQ